MRVCGSWQVNMSYTRCRTTQGTNGGRSKSIHLVEGWGRGCTFAALRAPSGLVGLRMFRVVAMSFTNCRAVVRATCGVDWMTDSMCAHWVIDVDTVASQKSMRTVHAIALALHICRIGNCAYSGIYWRFPLRVSQYT